MYHIARQYICPQEPKEVLEYEIKILFVKDLRLKKKKKCCFVCDNVPNVLRSGMCFVLTSMSRQWLERSI